MQKYNQNQLNYRILCANGDVSVMNYLRYVLVTPELPMQYTDLFICNENILIGNNYFDNEVQRINKLPTCLSTITLWKYKYG